MDADTWINRIAEAWRYRDIDTSRCPGVSVYERIGVYTYTPPGIATSSPDIIGAPTAPRVKDSMCLRLHGSTVLRFVAVEPIGLWHVVLCAQVIDSLAQQVLQAATHILGLCRHQ